jgi:DNA end-binding protein Ku
MAEAARAVEAAEEEQPQPGRAGRGIWSGTLTFGLVSIPVSLHPGTRNARVAFHLLDSDGAPVERKWACSAEDKVIDWDDIVRGYEIRPDEFVVVTDEELESLAPEKSRDIDLRSFVPRDDIDRMGFERAYWLSAEGGSSKAYRLLVEGMQEAGLAGIATFVMREREYLVAIMADAGVLRAETLRFADEIRTAKQVGLTEKAKAARTDVARVEKAIAKLAAPALDPAWLVDEREQRLMQLIAEKDRADQDVVKSKRKLDGEVETVVDLMERLKASLGEGRRGARSKRPAKAAGRKSAASATR